MRGKDRYKSKEEVISGCSINLIGGGKAWSEGFTDSMTARQNRTLAFPDTFPNAEPKKAAFFASSAEGVVLACPPTPTCELPEPAGAGLAAQATRVDGC